MRVAEKLIYASIAIFVSSLITKLWLFDVIVKIGIRDQTALRKRNELREIYLKLPFPLNFKVYFFNVSNPMEIQKGAKPIVKEVGPYWYDLFKEKIDVVDIEMEDSLTYTPYDIYKFNQNKSGSLREDDYVTIIHPVMVGVVNQVIRDSPVFLSIVNMSLAEIYPGMGSIFLTTKVRDVLFDGLEINCKSKNFSTNAVCLQMKNQIPDLKFKVGDEKIYLFSVLGPKNATMTKRIKILRGIDNSRDLGRLVEVDGEREISLWNTKQCNRFNGTDGWVFPPMLPPEEGLKSFATDLCRNIRLDYVNDTIMKDLNVRIYEADLGDQSTDENDKCYCRAPDSCLRKGVFDVSKCMKVPILTTLPHFYRTDETYLEKIHGLEPDADKHALRVAFEPMTGTPVKATKRMQFNFVIKANKKVAVYANLPDVLFPFIWVEESFDLEGDLLKKLQSIFLLLKLADGMMYMLIAFSIISCGVGIYYYQKNRREITITPVHEVKKEEINSDNDMQILTKRKETSQKRGYSNPAMSGHEFDRY